MKACVGVGKGEKSLLSGPGFELRLEKERKEESEENRRDDEIMRVYFVFVNEKKIDLFYFDVFSL